MIRYNGEINAGGAVSFILDDADEVRNLPVGQFVWGGKNYQKPAAGSAAFVKETFERYTFDGEEWKADRGAVKSVNGVEPDENGNVAIMPDWNQNNETAADYVKNRTHYDCDAEGYLLQETGLVNEMGGTIPIDKEPGLVVGNEYVVTWNGTEYRLTAESGDPYEFGDTYTYLGTGDPFQIFECPKGSMLEATLGAGLVIMVGDGTTELDISIYGKYRAFKRLDKKFIDVSPTVFYYNNTDGYIYTDNQYSTKATRQEVADALALGVVGLSHPMGLAVMYPVMVNLIETYGYMVALRGFDSSTSTPTFQAYYTAEYTAEE